MTRITFSQTIAGALVSLCLATVPAGAVSNQTYVSGKGADTGGCLAGSVVTKNGIGVNYRPRQLSLQLWRQ